MVVAISLFKLKTYADEPTFLETADRLLKEFLEQQRGFQNRLLLRGRDNQWADIVHWENQADADNAIERANSHPVYELYIQMMDEESVNLMHFEPIAVNPYLM